VSGGGATRPISRDGGVEEPRGDPTVGSSPKVWTRGQNGRSSAKDGTPERLRGGTIIRASSPDPSLMKELRGREVSTTIEQLLTQQKIYIASCLFAAKTSSYSAPILEGSDKGTSDSEGIAFVNLFCLVYISCLSLLLLSV